MLLFRSGCKEAGQCAVSRDRLDKGLEDLHKLTSKMEEITKTVSTQWGKIDTLKSTVASIMSEDIPTRMVKVEKDMAHVLQAFEKLERILDTVVTKVSLNSSNSALPKVMSEYGLRFLFAVFQAIVIAGALKYVLTLN